MKLAISPASDVLQRSQQPPNVSGSPSVGVTSQRPFEPFGPVHQVAAAGEGPLNVAAVAIVWALALKVADGWYERW